MENSKHEIVRKLIAEFENALKRPLTSNEILFLKTIADKVTTSKNSK